MGKRKGKAKGELLPGTLDMLVLQTIGRGRSHGYAIAQRIERLSGGELLVEEGSLYPALQRLELEGWMGSEWGETPNKRRARYYRLTPAGRRQLGLEVSNFERIMAAIGRVMSPVTSDP